MTAVALSFAWAVLVFVQLGDFYRGARWRAVNPRHVVESVCAAAFPALCAYAARYLP